MLTFGLRHLKALGDVSEVVQEGQGPRSSGALLAQLVERITLRMEPVMAALDDDVAGLEEALLTAPTQTTRRDILTVRRRTIILRRYLAPQKEALLAFAASEATWLSAEDRREIRLAADRTARYVEDLDALRDRAQVIAEEVSAALSARLDRNLYVLSILSAVFLPLGFLTGLLGINVGGMPGVDNAAAFWVVAGVCLGLGGGAIALFRWLRWF